MAKTAKKGRPNIVIWVVVVIIALAIGLLSAMFLRSVTETDQYYVLNTSVPARGQITPEMLQPMEAKKDQAPPNAIGISDVQAGGIYAQYPLNPGDILSSSNISGYTDISTGIPDDWVVTSFRVNADNAVGGRITRGTYFDIMATKGADGGEKETYYPFVNVLALDTTVSLNNASSASAVDTEEAQSGQTQFYYVGMTPENAAKLQSLASGPDGKTMKLVLSPRQNEYKKPDLNAYKGSFKYEDEEVIWPGESSDGEVTDYTFPRVERDECGIPVGTEVSAQDTPGNSKCVSEGNDSDSEPNQEGDTSEESARPSETPTPESSPSPSSASPSE